MLPDGAGKGQPENILMVVGVQWHCTLSVMAAATFKVFSLEIDMNFADRIRAENKAELDEDMRLAVEEIDPDWADHFHTIETAISFYRNTDDYKEALAKIILERTSFPASTMADRTHTRGIQYVTGHDGMQARYFDHG